MSPEEAWQTIFSNFDHDNTGRQRLRLPSFHPSTSGPLNDRPLPTVSLKKLSAVLYSCFFYDPHIIVGDENYIKTHVLRYLYFVNQHDLSDSNVLFEYPLPQRNELEKFDEAENRGTLRRYHQSWLAQQTFREWKPMALLS